MSIEMRDEQGKLRKDLVGTRVFGVPTGNNVRRGGEFPRQPLKQIAEFEVTKIGMKYLTLKEVYASGSLGGEHQYDPDSGKSKAGDCNAGYYLFESQAHLDKYIRSITVRAGLRSALDCRNMALAKYSDEQLEQVVKILNVPLDAEVTSQCMP